MKNLTEDNTRIQFLELLKAGLWDRQADSSMFGGETDWKMILHYAGIETVMPLVFEGISTLPESSRPGMKAMFKLMAYTDKIEEMNAALDKTAAMLTERLEKEKIHSVILKGQGVARNYPKPERRQCGDIDIYVGEKNYRAACKLLKQWGIDGGEEESSKHIHFEFNGQIIEVHKAAFEMSDRESAGKFRPWAEVQLEKNSDSIDIGAGKINVPPATFNALFIFAHAFHHFMQGGIGIRQLCDMTMLLSKMKDRIEPEVLREKLTEYKLLEEWKIFCCFCTECLGMQTPDSISGGPFSEKTRKKAARLLKFIFEEGNFGFNKRGKYYMDKPLLIRKTISLWKHLARFCKRVTICPKQTAYHLRLTLTNGFAAVFCNKKQVI